MNLDTESKLSVAEKNALRIKALDEVTEQSRINRYGSPYHYFWLFREDERNYSNYWDLLKRTDAPARLSDNGLSHIVQPLQWVPTLNPSGGRENFVERNNSECIPQHGLNHFGPTIIAATGAESFRGICLGWAQILAQGPDPLILPSGRFRAEEGHPKTWKPTYITEPRDDLVKNLQELARLSELVTAGDHFLLHLGI